VSTTISSIVTTIESDISGAIAKAKAAVATIPAAAIENRISNIETLLSADVGKVDAELSYVKANWGKVGLVVILAAAIGLIAGQILPHVL